jgi:hydrogenase maturation protein HypF
MHSRARSGQLIEGRRIRVRGLVQGVGFRPDVWRLAQHYQLSGEVWNDAEGVVIEAWGEAQLVDQFIHQLQSTPPPLARIEQIEQQALTDQNHRQGFRIRPSQSGHVNTGMVADAACCSACRAEIFAPDNRRYHYPFGNCTHCGPRLSIIKAIPYDRANTSMAPFQLCSSCDVEYRDPGNRRFHAQPTACPQCGPQLRLETSGGKRVASDNNTALAATIAAIRDGAIVAIKGLGGFQLVCDAGNADAVATLRQRKHRPHKPLALMARDVEMAAQYCAINEQEKQLLANRAAPIVLLQKRSNCSLASNLAPDQNSLGMMLPNTPLHHLLMAELPRPIVLTSGNRSNEPLCTGNTEARQRLGEITDYLLLHDRDIINRLDDSVLRVVADRPQMLRRARGYAPEPLILPEGFTASPPILAMGGDLKNSFCLLHNGHAIVSQHIGDLNNPLTLRDYRQQLERYRQLFNHQPQQIAIDLHPNYQSSQYGRQLAEQQNLALHEVQHHHAHLAVVMAEHRLPLNGRPVLGIALDGLGMGGDGQLWGGELLLADYRHYQRLAHLPAVPLPGGDRAATEPWRNLAAQLLTAFTTAELQQQGLEPLRYLQTKPLATLQKMFGQHINSPASSSCGRLFDAVAATLNLQREVISYEGQAAMLLERLANDRTNASADYPKGYLIALQHQGDKSAANQKPLWQALLNDLQQGVDAAEIAWRFHCGLVTTLCDCVISLKKQHRYDSVVLSGGVFQNPLLLEQLTRKLCQAGLRVFSGEHYPVNDGGIALGQAVIAAARALPGSDPRV